MFYFKNALSRSLYASLRSRSLPSYLGIRNVTATVNQTLKAQDEEYKTAKAFELMPKVPSFPIVHSMWTYLPIIGKYDVKKRHVADMKEYEEYGKIFRKNMGDGVDCVILYDPKDIEKMFRYEGQYPHRVLSPAMAKYRFGNERNISPGMVANNGSEWKDMRSKVQKHLLRPKAVEAYLPALNEVVDDAIRNIERLLNNNGEIDDLLCELEKYALEAVSLVTFDTRLDSFNPNLDETSEPIKMINGIRRSFILCNDIQFGYSSLWRYFPTRTWRELSAAMDVLRDASLKYVQKVKKRLVEKKDDELTLLETVLVTEKMTERDAVGFILDLLTGGIDTTSKVSSFTLYLLARHQEVQEKVHQEIIKHLPRLEDPVTPNVLNELKYLKVCLKESLRIFPILSFNRRTLQEDSVFSGYKVPAGTILIANTLAVGWLEENFPEPMKFKPERWLKENSHDIIPFSYLPFGFGPRMCVGRRIAEQEMWTLMAKVLQKFRLEYHHEDISMVTDLVHTPDKPIKMKFVPRT